MRVMLQEENREPTPEERNFDIRCMEAARRTVGANQVPSAALAHDSGKASINTRQLDY